MHSDPISDYLTRIRNAQMARHKVVEIPASNVKKELTKILFDQGYILNYKFVDEGHQAASRLPCVTTPSLVVQRLLKSSATPSPVSVATQVQATCHAC